MKNQFDMSLLYVEDEESIREELVYFLSKKIKYLHVAKDGQEGLELYEKTKPDLILTDINMPKLDGISMSQKIKELNPDAKIIMLTAFNDSDFLMKAIKIGVDNYLFKPINFIDLHKSIEKIYKVLELKKENEKVTNLLEQYKHTVDLGTIVSKTDKSGKITFINKQFEDISGYKEEELLGKSHNIVRHEDMPSKVFKELWQTIKIEKKPWFGKIKNKRKDGTAYYVDTVINPIFNSNGEIIEFIAMRTDITESEENKKHLKEQYTIASEKTEEVTHLSQLYEEAMDKSSTIIRIGIDKKIKHVNKSFCKLTGYSKEELIGKSYYELKHPQTDIKDIDNIFKIIDEKGIWKGQLKNLTKDGKNIYFIATVVSIKNKDGQIIEYLGFRKNITEIIELHNELDETQKEIIYKMGEIAESRSEETGNHVKRVAEYSKLLALKAGLSEQEAELLKIASPMHDLGKIAIPDSVLNKPGKLTFEEFEIMKKHTNIGYEVLNNSNRKILKAAAIIAYEHHEKWDGSGYPRALKEDDIHIYGRITAIADVFDALAHDRVYKKAWELDRILELFKEQKGKHFDPNLIDIFFENLDDFLEIKKEFE